MLFVAQKKRGSCGLCVVKFILKNYRNINISNKITTKYIPLSIISILLSDYLVDNRLKLVENKLFFEPNNYPEIIHCNFFGCNHYIVLLSKLNDYYVVYDPCSFGFKYISAKKLSKIMTGYVIELYGLKSMMIKKKFYLPYPLSIIIRFILFDFLVIILIFFLFY